MILLSIVPVHSRDVLNALSLVFTFDDSKFWIDTVGPKGAAITVAGEVYVRVAAGIVHIVAVETA